MLGKSYFESMRTSALAKLEGTEGLRAWIEWAKKEIPHEYACRVRYAKSQEAESKLRIAESMLRQLSGAQK